MTCSTLQFTSGADVEQVERLTVCSTAPPTSMEVEAVERSSGQGSNAKVEQIVGTDDALNIASLVKHLRQVEGRRRYTRHGGAACSSCLAAAPVSGRHYCAPCEALKAKARRAALK